MAYNLTDKAMLSQVSITQWTARKHDRKVSGEVAAQHGTHQDAGRYNKVLIAKEAIAAVGSAANDARAFHYANTLPWLRDGARILPAANYLAYAAKMQGHRGTFESAVTAFCDGYPAYVDDSRRRLNGLFNEADYPGALTIARRFSFDVEILPMPVAGDFRVELSDDETSRIKADIEQRTEAAVARAVRDLWQRVHDAVQHMGERMRAYGVTADGKTHNPFRDSVVTNLREIADLLPRLNVTGDPALDAMRNRLVAELCAHDPDTLRTSDTLRSKVADAAEEMLASMSGFVI